MGLRSLRKSSMARLLSTNPRSSANSTKSEVAEMRRASLALVVELDDKGLSFGA